MDSELQKIAFVYGDVCVRRRKRRRKRQKILIVELLYDYAKNSSLHGIRYITDRGLNIIEKVFWFITIVISLAICFYFIYNLFVKWYTSPVFVTVNERQTSVGTVPFPAVTICPQIKVKPSVYNYTKEMNRNHTRLSNDVKFQHVNAMCDPQIHFWENLTYKTNESFVNDLIEVFPTIDDIFVKCSWYDVNYVPCKEVFSRVYTNDGICYTANNLAETEIFEDNIQSKYKYLESKTPSNGWSLETGYNYSAKDELYPRRGHALGSEPDMQIILKSNPIHQDTKCNGLYSGFTIYLHHPADFPQSSMYYYAALPNQISAVAINFHQFNTDPSLKGYPYDIRQCYFPSDRKLRYFKIYTAKNCQAECLSNFTLDICQCVPFYMPHNDSNQICAPMNEDCLARAKDAMADAEMNVELGLNPKGCNCLPACNTIEYDAEILKINYYLQGFDRNNMYSRVDLFFKKSQFTTMQRRELFGVTDLVANIGGLLGVFLGFSFLSLIELFYFITLRVGFTLKRDLEEEKRNKKDKKDGFKTNN